MRRIRPFIGALLLALLLTSCSSGGSEKVSENSQPAPAKSTPTCSNEQFTEGSDWIKGQLNAFGDDNPAKAYSYASENFRQRNDIDAFTNVIVSQYSMLLNIKNYQILSCDKRDNQFLFKGKLTDKQDKNYNFQYLLSLINGKWGVDGAEVSEKVGKINY